MAFKSTTWYPIAVVLSVVNLVGAGFAVGQGQSEHAAVHAALAVAFGLWAKRLRPRRGDSEEPDRFEDRFDRLEALEGEVSKLRQELTETQERLDFVERLLAQGRDARRVGPQHPGPQPDVEEPK